MKASCPHKKQLLYVAFNTVMAYDKQRLNVIKNAKKCNYIIKILLGNTSEGVYTSP